MTRIGSPSVNAVEHFHNTIAKFCDHTLEGWIVPGRHRSLIPVRPRAIEDMKSTKPAALFGPTNSELPSLRYSTSGAWNGQSVVTSGRPSTSASTATNPMRPGEINAEAVRPINAFSLAPTWPSRIAWCRCSARSRKCDLKSLAGDQDLYRRLIAWSESRASARK